MNKKLLFLSIGLGLICSLAVNEPSLALTLDDAFRPDSLPTIDTDSITSTDPDNGETAATQAIILFVGNIVSQVLLFAGAIAIIFVLVSGGTYIFAFGDDTKIDKGKRGLFWSIAGLLIIMLSYAITRGVISLLLRVDS